ncbi:hypothetical protein PPL_04407 [Heterostelium album PN500]|uniref:Uncharacterized protein n=1 Tax=Heterostelium pallidum (strain ATCC 26659 / Pp 5 / PN500) TaxID=670386 RepID=D3B7G9_HETP5|nr:hypothetical protein PPL_04407 [Heterostelium album PN500]EFA82712.1 hypothetical protein PPL_04407 [Heterostelium album PN500]|eukprot:XP_020434829.1 hypothetical protein PPL_04407 [Heterostelium album PN500]
MTSCEPLVISAKVKCGANFGVLNPTQNHSTYFKVINFHDNKCSLETNHGLNLQGNKQTMLSSKMEVEVTMFYTPATYYHDCLPL